MSAVEQEIRRYFRSLYTDPVKHFVRINGWLSAARNRLTSIRSQTRRRANFAKYFTFPGEYAIDVLLLAENGVIEETNVGFPGVVYCESRPNILSEIGKRLGKCMGVFPFSFEKAVFTHDFRSFCPFDILNLDLTKEVFPRNGRPESNTIRAIEQLMWLHRNRDFDLYITFKASRRETNPDAVENFGQMVNDNFESNRTLKEAFINSCGMESSKLLESDFTLFWCKSFPKWILEQGVTKNVRGSIVGEFCYSRRPPRGAPYDIITFAFSFERSRRHYMSQHQMVSHTQREILRSFSLTPIDVDHTLENNVEIRRRLKIDVERLLQKPPKTAS